MEAVGRVFVPIFKATGIHFNLENYSGITFVCYEDGGAQAITIKESIDGASEQALATVKVIYASNGIGGVITRETTDANGALGTGDSAIVKKDTVLFDQAAFYIGASELDIVDGYNSVEVTVDAGECTAILHDLLVQRRPENLPATGV